MKQNIIALTALVPDIMEVFRKRYGVLYEIASHAPIGRRVLADRLSISERSLRNEIDFLKEQQLIRISREGMSITEKGAQLLEQLQPFTKQFLTMNHQEQRLSQILNIERVIIVPGDLCEDSRVLEQFSRVFREVLQTVLTNDENLIAVLGGTTLRGVADNMQPLPKDKENNIFISGRGGMGDKMEVQANTICDRLAQNMGGKDIPLYVPDYLTPASYDSLKKEPSIQRVLHLLSQATIAIHGIGDAMTMAKARAMSEQEIKQLSLKKAVAETFGYFYNAEGEVVDQIPRLGLTLEMLNHIPNIFAIAGGSNKAKAIHAYMKHAPHQTCLITDEGAAQALFLI